MARRKGMMVGKGKKGYHNVVPKDKIVHSQSARGMKQPQRVPVNVKNFIQNNPNITKDILKGRSKLDDIDFNDDAVEVVRTKKGMVRVFQDDNPESPREWDNLGNMFLFHNRYKLGDEHPESSDSFDGWEDIKNYLLKEKNAEILLPVYLYDHSGLRVKVGDFSGLLPQGHQQFDSGMIGYIYVTKKDIKENYGKAGKKEIEKAKKSLQAEVEQYDQYLSGDVWGYKSYDNQGEEVDSLWGLYGMDEAIKEGKGSLGDSQNKPITEKDFNEGRRQYPEVFD